MRSAEMKSSTSIMARPRIVLVAGILVLALSVAPAARAGDPSVGLLDGKSFSGELGEKGKAKGDKDEFIFKAGTFRSSACDAYGFKEAAYTASRAGDIVSFAAVTRSDKEGTMSWKGKVTGDRLEGTVVWKKGDRPTEYWFKGTIQH
jgi:hypothetical protein